MTEPQNPSPRSRMQALLAIPDNQRTEEQWDELHELEITLAPGNRIGHQEKQHASSGQGRSGGRGSSASHSKGGSRSGGSKGGGKGEGRGGRSGQPVRPAANPGFNGDAPLVAEGGEPAAASSETPAATPTKKPFRRFHKKPPKPTEA